MIGLGAGVFEGPLGEYLGRSGLAPLGQGPRRIVESQDKRRIFAEVGAAGRGGRG